MDLDEKETGIFQELISMSVYSFVQLDMWSGGDCCSVIDLLTNYFFN